MRHDDGASGRLAGRVMNESARMGCLLVPGKLTSRPPVWYFLDERGHLARKYAKGPPKKRRNCSDGYRKPPPRGEYLLYRFE